MKTVKFWRYSAAALFYLLVALACKPSKPTIFKVDPAYGKYVSAYTSGMITRQGTIRIELSKEFQPEELAAVHARIDELPDSTVLEDIFEFEPAISGKAVWVNDRVIEFIPDKILPANQFYEVYFDLDKVAEVKREHENFHFQFATFQQVLFVEPGSLRSQDGYSLAWQRLEGTLKTSDYEDSALLVKTLHVTQNGVRLPVRLEEGYETNEYTFYVDSIERKKQPGQLIVSWDGEAVQSLSQGKAEINIPALGDFSITDTKIVDREDQAVELTFSEPIAYNQNLDGIISISGVEKLTYKTEYNVVTVYLPNRLTGDRMISVSTGIRNIEGHNMLQDFSQDITFKDPKPLVRIKGDGSILPNSNGLIFPFESISLKAVDVRIVKIFESNVHHFLQVNNLDGRDELTRFGKVIAEKKVSLQTDKNTNFKQWNQHVLDLSKWITPDPGAIYRISIRFRKEYAVCDCETNEESGENSENNEVEAEDPDWSENSWSPYGFDDGYDSWYGYSDDYDACDADYYSGKAVARNILASDLGMIFKLGDDKNAHAFVSNLITTEPIAGATVEYFDFTKQLIAWGTTNAQGMLETKLAQKPFLMIAKLGKQRGYLKLGDGYANSLSKFDVEGEVVQKDVKGFIYGERGVWRPGDSLYLTFILENKAGNLPADHPVKFELQDPNGRQVYQVTKTRNVNGMYDFRTQTSTEAITGNYTALVKVGNRTFSKILKVETVKPNRLKIYLNPAANKTNDSTSKLTVKWLHGAVAKSLKANVQVTVHQSVTTFDKYKQYTFDSPLRGYRSDVETVFDGRLNEQGEAAVRTKLQIGQFAPGMLRATYITKVFEQGGDFSIDRNTVPYSPFKTYVGIRTPETNRDLTLETGHTHRLDVVTLSEKGELVSTPQLQVKIYKIQWRWWYEQEEEDLASYMARSGATVIQDTMIAAKGGKGAFNFRVNYPEYGRYLVTVTDLEGKHQTGKVITIDWPSWSRANRTGNEHANMLNFACDKEKYVKGENIRVSFPAPADGRALITVETRSKIIKKFWIRTVKGEMVHEFQATADMAPNAYVYVTMIQPHASTKNDLPIRMYGVVPVLVDDPETHLAPVITTADSWEPESTVHVKVKEQQGKRMTYTLAVVDDGLLDLTGFRTPEPWNVFYAREALGVRTWDIYDHVIGAYAGKLDKLLSIGGDGDANAGKSPKANRFKPMVRFIGPFVLEAGQEKNHQIELPNYVGSVRVMVVAQQDGAYGTTEKTVAVKKPLMVLATLPRVLGPNEQVFLPVNVFAMEKHIQQVKVTVEVNGLLAIEGAAQQSMTFKQVGDEVINFKLKVAPQIGIAKVKVTAVCGSQKSVQEIELDVRTPNPKIVEGMEMVLEPGKSWTGNIDFKGLKGTNKATIEASSVPAMGLEKRLDYLVQYPHGCIEQTTSAAFPQLYVSNLVDLKETQQTKISNNIKSGLRRLQLFQTSNGGFAYWPGESTESEWGTNYAGHFMVEAEKQGFSLPGNLKAKWVKFQQQQARNWASGSGMYTHPHGTETNEAIQAYRLFVLALSGNPELGAMNRLREERSLSATARWRLAAAYKLIGQTEVALKMIDKLPVTVKPYRELSYSYGSDTRDEAMILETLSLLDRKSNAQTLAKEVAAKLSSVDWMSTQETAYSLLAMCAYAGIQGNGATLSFSHQLKGGTAQSKTTGKRMAQVVYGENDFADQSAVTLKNTGKSTLFVKVMVEGIPLVGDQSAKSKDLSMKIVYKDMNGQKIQPDKLTQGMDFFAEVTVTNPGKKGFYKEMTLNQIFPSGWEIHNARMDGTTAAGAARYQDIRDDRVYSYYELGQGDSKTFRIQLNATYLGKFYLPTVYSEAMYDNLINARVPGKWVEVVRS
jgi:uncharacterized protein YfaS (alpha-2-macroglobulin family)